MTPKKKEVENDEIPLTTWYLPEKHMAAWAPGVEYNNYGNKIGYGVMRHANRWYELYKVKDLTKYEKYVCETAPVPSAVWDAILPAWFYTEGGIDP